MENVHTVGVCYNKHTRNIYIFYIYIRSFYFNEYMSRGKIYMILVRVINEIFQRQKARHGGMISMERW